MTGFNRKTTTLIGRLGAMTQRAAATAVAAKGGRVSRGVTRRTRIAVVGHGAYTLMGSGVLDARLDQARAVGADCISENTFLRRLCAMCELAKIERAISPDLMARQTGLHEATIATLMLFDVFETDNGMAGFRDLVAAREIARLRGEGASLPDIIASVFAMRRRDPDKGLSQVKLTHSATDGIVLQIGDGHADFDGQMQLPMPGAAANPSIDELFEAAEIAEEDGDFAEAESLYLRCLDLDRNDATVAFNLGNVQREQGKLREARFFFQHALSSDPGYVEAMYNLGDVLDKEGKRDEAKIELARAVKKDKNYADAIFNLAQLHFRDSEYADAVAGYTRYLALDDASDWSKIARQTLMLCRQMTASGG